MVEPNQLTRHLETFVDTTRSPTQQVDSLKKIASLLENDSLSINQLVTEMEMYLTTTDNIVRARGILLLAEILNHLKAKPLDNAVVHSLIGFFTEKLADWKAVYGALVGCLALLKRKDVAGVVTDIDVLAMAKAMVQNVQVQSLALRERKLCFELLECLLQQHSEAIKTMGDLLVYATCEAIDGEKDPQCLIVAFNLVELLARLFPSPSGPVASDASGIFECIGCYFPLHFTHTKGDEASITREDLSRGLMRAFCTTPFFEPYAIPLLLEKLSSSLPVAKVDSLKCLKDCTMKYGVDRMKKHYGGLWPALKDEFYSSTGTHLSFGLESLTSPGFEMNEIHSEAVNLLQTLVKQDISFLGFVVDDIHIKSVFDTISTYSQYKEMPDTSKLDVLVISQILYVSANASIKSCNTIFETFFFRLMKTLGIVEKTSTGDIASTRLYDGGLHLCIELLRASKDLTLDFVECFPTPGCAQELWFSMVKSFSVSLIHMFTSALCSSNDDSSVDVYFGVKGLLTMGMFPDGSSPVSRSEFEKILMNLTSFITASSAKTVVWELALKALVCIGSFIGRYHESDKAMSYMSIVVENLVSLACSSQCGLPYSMILGATSEVCSTGPQYVGKMVRGFEEAFCSSLYDFYVNGNLKSIDNCSQLLECLTNKLLPRVAEIDGLEKLLVHFVISMWTQIESCEVFSCDFNSSEFVEAAMRTMGQVVGIASVDLQNSIIQKAYSVVSSSMLPAMGSILLTFDALKGLQRDLSTRDELIISLFASVVIATSPAASIPDAKSLIHLFLVSLCKGYIPAAQALGSMVNKLGLGSGGTNISSDCSLEEACDIIFYADFASGNKITSNGSRLSGICGSETVMSKICLGFCGSPELQTHAITGLAWIGKGLLMRGDKRVNEITQVLVECLKFPNCSGHALQPSAMKYAADAFFILMSDSEVCLNKKFHAVIRPLYKQRFFSSTVPILESLIMNSETPLSRTMLLVALAHVISNVPVTVVLDNTKKLHPLILEALSVLSVDSAEKETLYNLLLVLSGTLTDTKGHPSASDNAHIIIECLVKLTSYPYLMVVRETAIQCLVALLELPHRRIYPFRRKVLQALVKALDDRKQRVRKEAIRCRQAWASITS